VASLLAAWWSHAAEAAARGQVADSHAFVVARQGAGKLELPPPLAERAIELELAALATAAPQLDTGGPCPLEPGAPLPLAAGEQGRLETAARPAGAGRARRSRGVSPTRRASARTAAWIAWFALVGCLAVLVAASVALGQAVPHVTLPGGASTAATDPYRAWLGLLVGVLGGVAVLVIAQRRRELAAGLRVPLIGLGGLALFGLGLLAGATWLEWLGGAVFALAGLTAWLGPRRAGRARGR
jgi:hypothetical protein